MSYLAEIQKAYHDFANYTWNEITFQADPWYVNYFWWLIVLSLVVWMLEIFFPWRKQQSIFRKDFWLDTFYMFFNFYFFKMVIFFAFSNVTAKFFLETLGGEYKDFAVINMSGYALWIQLLIFFLVTDFIQWFTHMMLHRFEFLWRFHKVYHSVEETYGPLKYLLNNPVMHLYHHAYHLPEDRRRGVNFGISLSLWDYIFGTNYVPEDSGTIKLGFPGMENFPQDFVRQNLHGFTSTKEKSSEMD